MNFRNDVLWSAPFLAALSEGIGLTVPIHSAGIEIPNENFVLVNATIVVRWDKFGDILKRTEELSQAENPFGEIGK